MPFIPVPDCAMVEIRGVLDGQKVENTLWFRNTAGWSTSSLTTLAGEVQLWYIDHMVPRLPSNYTLFETFAKDHTTAAGNEATVTPATTTPGGASTGAAGNVTIAVSFRTALGGRSFRGRNYIPGIPLTEFDGMSHVKPSYVTNTQNAYNLLLLAATITDAEWVVVSRFSGVNPTTGKPIPRATGIATPVTAALFTDATTDSQRRRLPGRGS